MFSITPPSSGGMVSNFLSSGPATSSFISPTPSFSNSNSFSGALGTSYTPSMFAPSKDYSSVFNSAARGSYGGQQTSSSFAPSSGGSSFGGSNSQPPQRSFTGGSSSFGGSGSRPQSWNFSTSSFTPNTGSGAPSDFYLGPAPTLKDLNIPYEEYAKRLGEVNDPDKLAALAEKYNAPSRKEFDAYMPGFQAGILSMGDIAKDYLGGRIPTSVAQEVARSSAATSFGTGLMRGGLGRNLTSRDLGLSSLGLQQTGADLFAKSFDLTQRGIAARSPMSVSSLMVAPQSIFDTMTSAASVNQQTQNQNLLNAWQTQALPGQFDVKSGKYVGYSGNRTRLTPLTPSQLYAAEQYEKNSWKYPQSQFLGPKINRGVNA